MISAGANHQATLCAELVRSRNAWPPGLGEVACPVILVHGEQDGVAPHATALDYCAMYPSWRYIGFPDEGGLVGFTRWRDVLDLVDDRCGAFGAERLPNVALALNETARHG